MQPVRCPVCGVTVGDGETECQGCGADVRLWVRREGQEWGPFDLATVRQGRAEGRIVDTDELRAGDGAWKQVGTLSFTPTADVGKPVVGATPSRPTIRAAAMILVVTVVVCGAIGLWSYFTWTTSQDDLHCRQNLTSIGLAIKAYSLNHGGAQPAMGVGLPEELKPYMPATTEWWTCPATKKPYLVTAATGTKAGDAVAWDAWDPNTSHGKGPHSREWHVLNGDGTVMLATAPGQGGVAVTGLVAPAVVGPAKAGAKP